MKISVVRPDELGPAELTGWRRMQAGDRSLRNPFLSPEFTLAVGRARADARVAVLEEPGGVAGFFPFERHAFGVGKPMGGWVSLCQGLIHADGLAWDPPALLRGCGLSVWEFNFLLASQAPFAPYHAVVEGSRVIDVSDGYGAYLERRRPSSKRLVKSTLYKSRRLEREVGPVRFEFDARDPDGFRRLLAWKSAQYRRMGRADRFAKPWVAQVVDELAAACTRECTGTLSMLYAGDEPVAGHFGLRSGDVLTWWFPAYEPRFARYSPGLIMLLRLAEAAAGAGLSEIDMGKGRFQYKESFMSHELPVAEGWVERPSGGALLRRVQRAPARSLRNVVLHNPALYGAADRTLRLLGRARARPRDDRGRA